MSSIFPKDFLWGAATSSHQIEGENTNDWSVWEKKTASERARKIPDWYEFPKHLLDEAQNPLRRISNKASDSFHRWKDDIKTLKEMGLNCYRFSVEWSRIFPEKGVVNEEGLNYYRNLIYELKANGIEPVLTCWHWTLPLWVAEEGGLLGKNIVKYFKEYFEVLAKNFGNDVKYWIVINEPDTVAGAGFSAGVFPPNHTNGMESLYVYFVKEVQIHKVGYKVIKNIAPNAMVGVAENITQADSYDNKPWNRIVAKLWMWIETHLFLDLVHNYLDFIGVNYYFYGKFGIKGQKNENDKVSDMGWWLKPNMLHRVLIRIYNRYKLPLIITENGLADSLDRYRSWWLDETFEAMRKAIGAGVDLRGYLHWSLLDNFEWAEGFWPKFGLVEIDNDTFDRKIKKSGYYYRDLINKERGK